MTQRPSGGRIGTHHDPTKIGVLGTGDVGRTLGKGFVSRGHDVKMGARASAGTFADAARHGETIVLATLWTGTKNAIDMAGVDSFAGKWTGHAFKLLRAQ